MIDSHCHLDHEPLLSNLDDIIKRSKSVGIKKILTICTTLNSFEKIKEIIKKDEIIYGTYGIHPHETKDNIVNSELIINQINDNDKIIGVGESGLDFYYNNSDKNLQIKSFEEHIKASIELNVPIIIHSRNAELDTLKILKKYKNDNLRILMHCFTGSKKFAEDLSDLNAYFSASGIITFKNSLDLQKTFQSIPVNRLLIETDSPFLAPEPNRGKKNEPSFIRFTGEKLASLKNISFKDLIISTTNNFNRLFN
tara:strand:+ start:522 stop:1280 length:759 start_codon:yes stop_codon:yes gene_type:complete